MSMPKKIHYFWVGNEISKESIHNITAIKAKNPGFEINLWTDRKLIDKGINNLLFNHMTKEEEEENDTESNKTKIGKSAYDVGSLFGLESYLNIRNIDEAFEFFITEERESSFLKNEYNRNVYGNYHNYALASDISRLVILYMEGGIYLDIDVKIKRPPFITDKDEFFSKEAKFSTIDSSDGIAFGDVSGTEWHHDEFGNAVIAAPEKSRKVASLLRKMEENIRKNNRKDMIRADPEERLNYTMETTGPFLYSEYFREIDKNQERNNNLPPENMRINMKGSVFSADASGNWKNAGNTLKTNIEDKIKETNKYLNQYTDPKTIRELNNELSGLKSQMRAITLSRSDSCPSLTNFGKKSNKSK
jgi:mannosyltransferase OCH1-like enzyme